MISLKIARDLRLGFGLVAVLLVSLSCNFLKPTVVLPEETIPVTTQAVEELKQDIEAAATQAEAFGQATLVIDEAELTSLVAFELQKEETPVIQEPQIFLRDGQMQIAASIVQGEVNVPVQITVAVSVDNSGQPQFQILTASIGSVALPEDLVVKFSDQLARAFDQNVRPRLGDVFIQSITIADGKMTIQGTTQ